MLPDEFPAEYILESIDTIIKTETMSPPEKKPKVILFDIGGVCVCLFFLPASIASHMT